MAKRPQILQTLRHGRLLCGAAFRHFVETWNWLVSAFDGLKGDFDMDPRSGHVTIDRTVPDAPVVRLCNLDDLKRIVGGGGLSSSLTVIEDLQYDVTSHQLQAKYATVSAAGTVTHASSWQMITGGQAVAHTGV